MALQIKTIRGRKYVYDVKSFWDKERKKFRKHTTYMGPCINEETKEYAPKKKEIIKVSASNKQILNYGDAYHLQNTLARTSRPKQR